MATRYCIKEYIRANMPCEVQFNNDIVRFSDIALAHEHLTLCGYRCNREKPHEWIGKHGERAYVIRLKEGELYGRD